jgi:broad specificity phosphatase PhoE
MRRPLIRNLELPSFHLMDRMLTIHLAPVGATDFSPNGELLGINNPPLNSAGVSHADAVAVLVKGIVLEAVFSGPLKRQMVTARRIAMPHSLPVRTEKNLMDVNYGSLSGRTWSEIRDEDPNLILKLSKSPHRFRFPSGEKTKKSWKRLQNFARYLLGNFGVGHVVVVADDFVIMMLVSLITGTDFIGLEPWKPSNGGVTVIDCDQGKCTVSVLRGTELSKPSPTQ